MKSQIIKNTVWLLFLSIHMACTSFLEENPEDRYVAGNFYKTSSDAEAAVNAVYEQLYSIYKRRMYLLCDLPTDDHKNGKGMPNSFLLNLEFCRHTPENQFVREMWQSNYSGIMRANAAIKHIPGIKMDGSYQSRLIAESKFLRALFYFNLVRFYGDVPLVNNMESIDDAFVKRSPKEEVYKQIITDLEFAESHLPVFYDVTNIGRVTRGASKILLGKVFLTHHEFQNAVGKLSEVVLDNEMFGYRLLDNYGDNWKEETENGKEMVFSIEYMSGSAESNNQMALCAPKHSIHDGAGVPGLKRALEADIPTVELYDSFRDDDERKEATFKLDYHSPADGKVYTASIPLFGKYWEEDQVQLNQSGVNMHIIRYADALLMYAEALNEIGQTELGLTYLNRVRERAFNNSSQNYAGLSKEQFQAAVWKERRLEFALEGHRWFDLVRTGRFIERMLEHGIVESELAENNKTEIADNIKDYMALMPIPQYEIELNRKLVQNPGY